MEESFKILVTTASRIDGHITTQVILFDSESAAVTAAHKINVEHNIYFTNLYFQKAIELFVTTKDKKPYQKEANESV